MVRIGEPAPAFTLPSTQLRDEVIQRMRTDEYVLVLGSGPTSIRFRPALTATAEDIDRAEAALDRVLHHLQV